MSTEYVLTSESVCAGHPDKLCDRISDEIVDRMLQQDPSSRVVAECAVSSGVIFLATRVASAARIDLAETARQVVRQTGYRPDDFDAEDCTILTSNLGLLPEHYPAIDVADLDDAAIERIPPGNQVTVFGFATRQTANLMPLPLFLAHRLVERLDEVTRKRTLNYLIPDGKSQVAVRYADRRPVALHSVTLTACQSRGAGIAPAQLRDDLIQCVIEPVLAEQRASLREGVQFHINPEGPFIGGGPSIHAGLTGRKTAIDTYGECARHSGAALSGKDPLRIDRAGAYAARYAAKHVVAAGLADDCELQLSYAVGQARPISVYVDTFNTGAIDDAEISRRVLANFELRPAGITRALGLQSLPRRHGGFYRHLAAYGHMGRVDLDAPWERLDRLDSLTTA
ncbi:MAG: methionine adenosyltransferase [Thiohalocapsa sp.]|nr:methionine adenosyltransferase [Thiohalocapsa sp.]MCF7990793.1 methionine adenosyltransferase [Thiohalocapsa sp.]